MPDPYTLRVHLTEITNDLGYRFALPATAPIPPSPTDSSARFGAAEGTMMATDASLPPAVPT